VHEESQVSIQEIKGKVFMSLQMSDRATHYELTVQQHIGCLYVKLLLLIIALLI
jgi:hypothetical protein